MQTQESGYLKFTVDAALFVELGERLIGKPYIALGELVKNSYDADATKVTIQFDLAKKRVVVVDNGHGMTFNDFENYWMRIGSKHKGLQRISKTLKRQMTGSKGVGRLAVQYLAHELTLTTVSKEDRTIRLEAHVNWDEAVSADNLTEARVDWRIERSSSPLQPGTTVVLARLKQHWDEKAIEGLAEEVWWLTPPFRPTSPSPDDEKNTFDIIFQSQDNEFIAAFNGKMHAIMNIWHAKIVGKNSGGKVDFSLQFRGEDNIIHRSFDIPDCLLRDGSFEVRIYSLHKGRQPGGLKVGEIREYFEKFGGVHVYDGGFHLPYYGDPKNDWLKIEFDHSHRLTLSEYLEKDLQVERGMNFLPTLSRIYGVVNVDTSKEPELSILITRDRLEDSSAFKQLVSLVRYPIDFYATQEAARRIGELESERNVETVKFTRLEDVIDRYRQEIPEETFSAIRSDLEYASEQIQSEAERMAEEVGILGSLTTAAVSNALIEHELHQQYTTVEDLLGKLELVKPLNAESARILEDLRKGLITWTEKVKSTFELFSNLGNPDNIQERERLPAKATISAIWDQMNLLTMGIPLDTKNLNDDFLLPRASYSEWSAIFQNVFLNSVNAIDAAKRSQGSRISVSSRIQGSSREIVVQDTGVGLDLKDLERLFKPFQRALRISDQRRSAGFGGTGLGLTIVRIVSNNIGCRVTFISPENGYKTAFSLSWREKR